MGEDDDGNGHGIMLPECKQMFKEIKCDIGDIKRAMWGGEGTTGMVKDINDQKMQNRLLIFLGATAVGVFSAVVTSVIILSLGGKF